MEQNGVYLVILTLLLHCVSIKKTSCFLLYLTNGKKRKELFTESSVLA